HEELRHQQPYRPARLRNQSKKLGLTAHCQALVSSDTLDKPESRIVPCALVLEAGIAEPDDQGDLCTHDKESAIEKSPPRMRWRALRCDAGCYFFSAFSGFASAAASVGAGAAPSAPGTASSTTSPRGTTAAATTGLSSLPRTSTVT